MVSQGNNEIDINIHAPARLRTQQPLLFSDWVSFLLAFSSLLVHFCSEISCLVLKIDILSFASCCSSRFSNSSERCVKSLWRKTHWTRSCFSHWCFYCLCPQNTVVVMPHHPLQMRNTDRLSVLLEGNKGLQKSRRWKASLIPPR